MHAAAARSQANAAVQAFEEPYQPEVEAAGEATAQATEEDMQALSLPLKMWARMSQPTFNLVRNTLGFTYKEDENR